MPGWFSSSDKTTQKGVCFKLFLIAVSLDVGQSFYFFPLEALPDIKPAGPVVIARMKGIVLALQEIRSMVRTVRSGCGLSKAVRQKRSRLFCVSENWPPIQAIMELVA